LQAVKAVKAGNIRQHEATATIAVSKKKGSKLQARKPQDKRPPLREKSAFRLFFQDEGSLNADV